MNLKLTLSRFLLAAVATALCAPPALNSQPAASAAAPPAPTSGARIQFQTPVYDFGKVKAGELVKHTFVFTNTGDAVLVLTNVQTTCGCTTAGDWTRQVEPGQTGAIPVQFNSAANSGPVIKQVTVTSNDKAQPTAALQLKGLIWEPIEVQPKVVVLVIPPEARTNVTATVRIHNNLAEPIEVWGPESSHRNFAAEVETNAPGKDFRVIISAVPPFDPASAQGQITLRTSSTNTPVLRLTAMASLQQLTAARPPQVRLPAGPLPASQTMGSPSKPTAPTR